MAQGFKTGGRAKGSPNKNTLRSREILQQIIETEIESGRIEKALATLEGKDYLTFLLKLSAYVIPKATRQDIEQEPADQVKPVIIAPIGTQEEVAALRKGDPDEATMAELFYYHNKKNPRNPQYLQGIYDEPTYMQGFDEVKPG